MSSKHAANDVGYSVTLRINGRAFAASAIVANGDTVGSTYKQIVTQLAEVYGDIDRKPEYADIAEMPGAGIFYNLWIEQNRTVWRTT